MSNDNNVFKALETVSVPETLSFSILGRIQKHKQRAARIRLAFLSFTSLLSAVAIIPAVSYTLTGFAKSGFYEYFSLLFSDGLSVLPFWKEFALTLVESLPTLEIALTLAIVYALLESLKLAIKNAPVAFYQYKH